MSPTLLVSSMSPRGRLRLRLMPSTVPTVPVLVMLDWATLVWATLVWATLVWDMLVWDTAMLPLLQPLLQLLPATPTFPPLPLSPPLELSLLSEELTPVPDVMSPTLLVSSMLLRV